MTHIGAVIVNFCIAMLDEGKTLTIAPKDGKNITNGKVRKHTEEAQGTDKEEPQSLQAPRTIGFRQKM